MEFLSLQFWQTLLSLVIIDLLLAGDNAIVIGLAAKNLPKARQKQAIFWGTLGAVGVRSLTTLLAVWLLKIPGLLFVGGVLLLFIAYRLITGTKETAIEAKDSLGAAIRTIVLADAVMGIDNVLAVAGASHGSFLMVLLGLLISVPIVAWGSTLFITLTEKFPFIITLGGGIIAWTAAKMILDDPLLQNYLTLSHPLEILVTVVVVTLVLTVAWLGKNKKHSAQAEVQADPDAMEPRLQEAHDDV